MRAEAGGPEKDTSTPAGARAHARSMAGMSIRTMPTIPASSARDLPEGIDASALVWDETIGSGGYSSRVLRRGSRLRLVDVDGDACANLLVYNAHLPTERLNVADTIKVQWTAYLGEGRLLLSDMGRVLMSIVGDTSGRHDVFSGCSNETTNRSKYGDGANHGSYPNARDRFLLGLAKYGLGRKDLMPNINLFKKVTIGEDGAMTLEPGGSAGSYVEMRAEMDVLVVLANTPHVLDERPEYSATPLRLLAWRGSPGGEDDPIRGSTPEARRAFENTEDWLTR